MLHSIEKQIANMSPDELRQVRTRGIKYIINEKYIAEAFYELINQGNGFLVNSQGKLMNITRENYEYLRETNPIASYNVLVNKLDLENYIKNMSQNLEVGKINELIKNVNDAYSNIQNQENDYTRLPSNELKLRILSECTARRYSMFSIVTNVISEGRVRRQIENYSSPLTQMSAIPDFRECKPTVYDLKIQIEGYKQEGILNDIGFIEIVLEFEQTRNLNTKGYDIPESFLGYFWKNKFGAFQSWLASAVWYSALAMKTNNLQGKPVATPKAWNFPSFIKQSEQPFTNTRGQADWSITDMCFWNGFWQKILDAIAPNADGTAKDPFGVPKFVPYTEVITAANVQTIFQSIINASNFELRNSFEDDMYNKFVFELDNQATHTPKLAAKFLVSLKVWGALQECYHFQGVNTWFGYEVIPVQGFVGNNILFGIFNDKTYGSMSGALMLALRTEQPDGTPFFKIGSFSDGREGIWYKMEIAVDCILKNGNNLTVYTEYIYNPAYPLPNQNIL